MLSHYWSTNEDQALRRAQAADWLNDLEEFPAATVAEVCQMWRRSESRRPTIADIRKLCLETKPRPPERLALPRATSEYHQANADRRREYETAEQARQRFAQEHGYPDFAAVMQRGIQSVAGPGNAGSRNWRLPPQADLIDEARKRLGLPPLNEPQESGVA